MKEKKYSVFERTMVSFKSTSFLCEKHARMIDSCANASVLSISTSDLFKSTCLGQLKITEGSNHRVHSRQRNRLFAVLSGRQTNRKKNQGNELVDTAAKNPSPNGNLFFSHVRHQIPLSQPDFSNMTARMGQILQAKEVGERPS